MRALTMAEQIADAAMLVIARDGHDALSVRRIAAEVSVTGGTVQHHFPTKVEPTVAALDRCVFRQGARIMRQPSGRSDVESLTIGIAALLPTDSDRRIEAAVWIALSAVVSGNPDVAASHRRAVDAMQRWLRALVESAQSAGEVTDHIDIAQSAQLIEAGLDGLILAGISKSFAWNKRSQASLKVLVDRVLLIAGNPPRR